MTIGNHVYEVARQLWASLTGGWCYEPANSVFCNTIHLYLWCMLLVLPLLLSFISANGSFSLGVVCGYVGFTVILFAVLKLIVGYLHNVFDTAEPIITHKPKNLTTLADPAIFCRSPMSSFSGVCVTDNNAIEMVDLNMERSQELRQSFNNKLPNNLSNNLTENAEKRICIDLDDLTLTNDDGLSLAPRMCSIFEDENCSLSASNSSANALINSHQRSVNGAPENMEKSERCSSSGVLLSMDSLELLPLSANISRQTNKNSNLRHTISYFRRKYSDPNTGSLSVRRFEAQQTRSFGDSRLFAIRRVQSSSEAQCLNTLDKCVSPTTLNSLRGPIKNRKTLFLKNSNKKDYVKRLVDRSDTVQSWLKNEGNAKAGNDVSEESKTPCCSKDLLKCENLEMTNTNYLNEEISEFAFSPTVDMQKLMASSLHKTMDRLEGENTIDSFRNVNDLKGEITKFLEELIEKHPETLDAIENVRMNRLGRTPLSSVLSASNTNARLLTIDLVEHIGSRANETRATMPQSNHIYNLNLRDGTHVAYDHEDTSQGAIHSFQDGHGNWWTYAFDEQSSGTAQALGSSRAISEMFNKRRRRRISDNKSLDVFVPMHQRQSSMATSLHFFQTFDENNVAKNEVKSKISKYCEADFLKALEEANLSNNVLPVDFGPDFYPNKPLSQKDNLEILKNEYDDCVPSTSSGITAKNTTCFKNTEVIPKVKVLNTTGRHNLQFPLSQPLVKSNQTKKHKQRSLLKRGESRRASHLLNPTSSPKTVSMHHQSSHSLLSSSSSSPLNFLQKHQCSKSSTFSFISDKSDEIELAQYFLKTPTSVILPSNVLQAKNVLATVNKSVTDNFSQNEKNRLYSHRRHQSDSGQNTLNDGLNKSVPLSSTVVLTNSRFGVGTSNAASSHNFYNRQTTSLQTSSVRTFNAEYDSATRIVPGSVLNSVVGSHHAVGRFSHIEGVPSERLRRLAANAAINTRLNNDNLSLFDRREFYRSSMDSGQSLMVLNESIFGGHAVLGGGNANALSSRRHIRSLSSMRIINDFQSFGLNQNCLHNISNQLPQNRTKVNYHYKIKVIPRPLSIGKGIKIKIDRLKLSALFDRNYSFLSGMFDVFFAALVSFLAAMLISLKVYSYCSLLFFAFVVAGCQFSLIKSVQPDSASPVHGFNWLIAYSRPTYFCILAFLYLIIDFLALNFSERLQAIGSNWTKTGNLVKFISFEFSVSKGNSSVSNQENSTNDIGLYWMPVWLKFYSNVSFFFSFKDLASSSILFLPLAFTFGLLPQVDTLAMHIIEQIDIHLFGATASFSLLSSIFSLFRSIMFVTFLSIVSYFAHQCGPGATQNFAFSAFVALTISTAFLASRWSSNPLVMDFLYDYFCKFTFPKTHRHQNRRRQLHVSSNCRSSESSLSCCLSSVVSSSNLNSPFIKSLCCKFGEKSASTKLVAPINSRFALTKVNDQDEKLAFVAGRRKSSSISIDNISLPINQRFRSMSLTEIDNRKSGNSTLNCPVNKPSYNEKKDRLLNRTNSDVQSIKEDITNTTAHQFTHLIGSKRNEITNNKPLEDVIIKGVKHNSNVDQESGIKPDNLKTSKACLKHNIDTMPQKMQDCIIKRLHYDIFYTMLNTLIFFGLHSTSLFWSAQPYFEIVICVLCILFGFCNHYIYPQLRTHTPWKLLAQPLLKPYEFFQYETTIEAKLMNFERVHVWMIFVEKTILYPLLVVSLMSTQAWQMPFRKVELMALCSFRIARSSFAYPQLLYIPLTFTFFFSFIELSGQPMIFKGLSAFQLPTLFILYVFFAIWPKIQEFILKMNFIFVYIAPWQISWGSAFHAFAQPFSVPHTGVICAQAAISSILSAPLNSFLGSSFFLMSYIRPVKFWEKDYNTKQIDHSNLRLISQLDRGPMLDDSNLNAIFYEHLMRSLQKSLAGDLLLGRWATSVQQGDCFILASLNLNCLVHIIEVGNGFVTFQLRGLEFCGTYCHQREVEAISEDQNDNGSWCCYPLGKVPGMLSFNNAWSLRWLAWEVVTAKYVIDGYSITDNSAVNLLQVHELRRLLVTLYVKCTIFYATISPHFEKWLTNETILKALEPIKKNPRFVDSDQIFCAVTDEDYDFNLMGISKQCFIEFYGEWINHCLNRRRQNDASKIEHLMKDGRVDLNLVICFSYALSILSRRALGTASFNRHANSAESFLFGLHALFKGDMRITSLADEWVLSDPEILTQVTSPAIRMSLKLHQDHFAAVDEFEEIYSLYNRINQYHLEIFISHEHDPAWREAIIANTPSLLALRHIFDDGQDDYKIIMLNKMHLNMRVIKLNRECVRAFWAGQQQELIFLRNRNPERGSIQNARQVLRNMINSSADQPIGYPIFVSPLVTSFVEMHSQMESRNFGQTITFQTIFYWICQIVGYLRQHFGTSGSSNLPAQSAVNVLASQPTLSRNIHLSSGAGVAGTVCSSSSVKVKRSSSSGSFGF